MIPSIWNSRKCKVTYSDGKQIDLSLSAEGKGGQGGGWGSMVGGQSHSPCNQ